MPIPIGDITQAVQGTELVSTDYASCDGLIATVGQYYRKLAKSVYALASHSIHPLIHLEKQDTRDFKIYQWPTGTDNVFVGFTSGVTKCRIAFSAISGGAAINMYSDWDITMYPTNRLTVQQTVRTWPQGSNFYVYADGFVEWSELAIKEDVRPLDSLKVLKCEPKVYTQKGEQKAGLVVEDVEPHIPEAIKADLDEAGKPVKGICWSAIISHILSVLRNFETRLIALEAKP